MTAVIRRRASSWTCRPPSAAVPERARARSLRAGRNLLEWAQRERRRPAPGAETARVRSSRPPRSSRSKRISATRRRMTWVISPAVRDSYLPPAWTAALTRADLPEFAAGNGSSSPFWVRRSLCAGRERRRRRLRRCKKVGSSSRRSVSSATRSEGATGSVPTCRGWRSVATATGFGSGSRPRIGCSRNAIPSPSAFSGMRRAWPCRISPSRTARSPPSWRTWKRRAPAPRAGRLPDLRPRPGRARRGHCRRGTRFSERASLRASARSETAVPPAAHATA